MFAVIKPLGLLLATLPVGPEHPGVTAGANFQLFYQKSFLLPHRRATWIRFTERLDEAAEFADGIGVLVDELLGLVRVRTAANLFGAEVHGRTAREPHRTEPAAHAVLADHARREVRRAGQVARRRPTTPRPG